MNNGSRTTQLRERQVPPENNFHKPNQNLAFSSDTRRSRLIPYSKIMRWTVRTCKIIPSAIQILVNEKHTVSAFILASMALARFPTAAATNFADCLAKIQDGAWKNDTIMGPNGTDNQGHSVPFSENTTAITYHQCLYACGSGAESFNWSVFEKQFSAWLLPWLAFVSQLPFGDEEKVDDFIATLLTVGSPTLAAYSLACTILNGHWVALRLRARKRRHRNSNNTEHVIHVLNNLQQYPLQLTSDRQLLGSLVENDKWWDYLGKQLAGSGTWAISSATSIAWVFIAYIFTVIDSLSSLTAVMGSLNENGQGGQGVGSVWLWLVPVVVGWLQCLTNNNLKRDLNSANDTYAITSTNDYDSQPEYAISLASDLDDPFLCETGLTNPIYNYIRFFSWIHAVEMIVMEFEQKPDRHSKVPEASESGIPLLPLDNAQHSTCIPIRRNAWTFRVWSRCFIASILALSLQWGTAGSVIIVFWFTPTTGESPMIFSSKYTDLTQLFFQGLGCRSAGYLLYATVSTLVWMILVLSSILFYYASSTPPTAPHQPIVKFARNLSIFFRRLGKIIASLNAIWIVALCLFQFSNFFSRCWCNSSVLGRGPEMAFNVIELTPEDTDNMKGAWIGGIALASGTALIFFMFTSFMKVRRYQSYD